MQKFVMVLLYFQLQTVEKIEDSNPHGLYEGQVLAMIHSGSRGFGHQVCTDHVRSLESRYRNRDGIWYDDEWELAIPDRQLAAAPIHSKEGEEYLDAMNAAANYALIIPYHKGETNTNRTQKFIAFFRKYGKVEEIEIEIKCYYTSYRHIWCTRNLRVLDPKKPEFLNKFSIEKRIRLRIDLQFIK